MERTVLILGSTGRFGRNAVDAFKAAGWEVRSFKRNVDNLWDAAWGASVIVNGWNPAYPDWAREMPVIHVQVREVAKAGGATVILPGNVYNFGASIPDVLDGMTPQSPTTQYGELRVDMEAAYRREGVRTIVLRAGDFIDTKASGNWFDMVITKPVARGAIRYPRALNIKHAWAFLPDMARAAVMLAEKRHMLDVFEDIPFAGFVMTGHDLASGLASALDRPIDAKKMAWLPLQMARPFWKGAKPLNALRYLWDTPHELDGTKLTKLLPEFRLTDLSEALRLAVHDYVHPHQAVSPGSQSISA